MRHPPVSCGGGRFPLTVPRAPGNSAASLPPLVAVAHGSADPRATATVTALLGIARRRAAGAGLPGIDARAAYLGHTPPTLAQALSALGAPAGGGAAPRRHAVVLPLLLTGAYHATTDIPALLRDARAALPWLRVAYGSALGPHPLLLRALERRLAEAVAGPLQPRSTAVVLAAAGSADPQGRAAVAGTAARWQAARGWHSVTPAYASAAPPAPGEAVEAALRGGARRVVVATYLLAPGIFADQIRRDSFAAGAAAVSAALGAAPEVADVVLDRYAGALAAGGSWNPGEPRAPQVPSRRAAAAV
ncbi:MAG TPA: CbiX/SirB N-terminal domain-containing protein [Streptosporangiaceae bacterium]|nr:CbiX/SirB N-terminal domain-containing protein [Streptosporangiaceae bacterium]